MPVVTDPKGADWKYHRRTTRRQWSHYGSQTATMPSHDLVRVQFKSNEPTSNVTTYDN